MSASWLDGWSVGRLFGWSVCYNSLKSKEFGIYAALIGLQNLQMGNFEVADDRNNNHDDQDDAFQDVTHVDWALKYYKKNEKDFLCTNIFQC